MTGRGMAAEKAAREAEKQANLEREAKMVEIMQGYMAALDARILWERVDQGFVFTMWRTPKANQFLVVRSTGANHPWIEVFAPIDNSNRWDRMFEYMQNVEDATT